jgi:putative PLP-dependent aminotransferase (TIGR04422 family)
MKHDGDIWIKPRRKIIFRGDGDITHLEDRFEKSFVGGYPVILGSARAGVMLILKEFHTSPLISIFPFASQCVVKAATLSGKSVHTPLPNMSREVIYNQWGLHQNHETLPYIFLVDSADSLYPLGGEICKSNSRFEVWSFPKIVGTTFGGVVWCRNKSDAQKLREIRNELPLQKFLFHNLLYSLKSLSNKSYQYWENYEFSHPGLSKSQVKILNLQLNLWSKIYSSMRRNYNIALLIAENTDYPKDEKLDSLNSGVIPTVIEWKSTKANSLVRKLTKVNPDGFLEKKNVYAYQKEIRAI